MSRVINTNSVGKQRNQLVRGIVIAIRELMRQSEPTDETKDLAAFISFALDGIYKTIEVTVAPWEKRNYWVKADKFRQEWAWTSSLSEKMKDAAILEDWARVAELVIIIGGKLNNVEVSDRHRMGKPWKGAWDKLKQDQVANN